MGVVRGSDDMSKRLLRRGPQAAMRSVPAVPIFGGLLPARIPLSTGSVTNVATEAELTSALGSVPNGSIINITASLTGTGANYIIGRNASALAPITITRSPGVLITNYMMWDVRGSYLRLKDLDIGYGTIDNILIDVNANHVEIDGCIIHNAARMGINVQPSPTDIQVWNCTIYTNGSVSNGALDHGIYFAYARGACVIANNVFYNNCAFNMQIYPDAPGVIFTCNTLDGGQIHPPDSRGGLVIGSNSGGTSNCILVGNLYTNAPLHGIEVYNPSGLDVGNNAYDSLAYNNGGSDYDLNYSGMTYTNCTNGNPLYVNVGARDYHLQAGSPAISKVQAVRYGYVPPLDKDGNARVTADAGAYGAAAVAVVEMPYPIAPIS